MNLKVTSIIVLSIATTLPALSEAKGCLAGAAVGGVGGHVAGHHGLIGAAAGCAVGHHMANKKSAATPSGPVGTTANSQVNTSMTPQTPAKP